MALMILISGCAVAARAVGKIVLDIGTDIVVSAGADFIREIFSSEQSKGQPTLVVSFTNAAGDGTGTTFAVDGVTAITVRTVSGDIHVVGDGDGVAVTVAADTTATIEIGSIAGGGTAHITADAGDQAATVDGIIRWSGRSRTALSGALADLDACRNIAAATSALQGVADGRAQQIDALDGIDVSALPDGGSIRDSLLQALRYSSDADLAFVRWGEHVQRPGCRKDGDYDQGMSLSRNATRAKSKFVSAWNPIARAYGLPEYREPDI